MRRTRWIACVAGMAAIAGGGTAIASDNVLGVDRAAGPAAGVQHAREAGITLDPGAAEAMTQAPAGSCYNDPTLDGCPKVRRVATPIEVNPDGGYAPADTASASTARAARHPSADARAAAAVFQCFVRATSLSRATGSARAYGTDYCTTANVSSHELFVTLREHWASDGDWHQMDVGHFGPKAWDVQINGHAEFKCRSTAKRQWQDNSQGYAVANGVLYGGQNVLTKTIGCVG